MIISDIMLSMDPFILYHIVPQLAKEIGVGMVVVGCVLAACFAAVSNAGSVITVEQAITELLEEKE